MIDYDKYSEKLAQIEAEYDYNPDKVFYYNVHRPSKLIFALQSRYKLFNFELIHKIIKHALHSEVIKYEHPTNAGTGHLIIFITLKNPIETSTGITDKVVLRTNLLLDIPEKYMDYEKTFSQLYKQAEIPSSEILFSDTSRKLVPFDYQIMEVLPGESLYEFKETQKNYDNIAFQLGQAVAREYKIPMKNKGWGRITKDKSGSFTGTFNSLVDFINAYLEHDLKILTLFNFISTKEGQKLQEFFSSNYIKSLFADTPHGFLVHNDPSDHNIRYEKDQFVAIFDWENTTIYDPISELGTASTWTSAYPKEKQMIKGFVSELGYRPKNLEKKMAVYFLRKTIDKAQFALRGKRLAPKHIRNFNIGLKRNNFNFTARIELN